MLLTSSSFLFFFLPFSLLINYLNLNKKRKIILLGSFSAYFYFLDNGYLILILIFLALVMNFQIKKFNIEKGQPVKKGEILVEIEAKF